MRVALTAFVLLSFTSLTACGTQATENVSEGEVNPMPAPSPSNPAPNQPQPPTVKDVPVEKEDPPPPPPPPPPAVDADLQEVVYVLMRDNRNRRWFCTGALIASDKVLTAGHCLDAMFLSYEIVAPLAAGAPRVSASNPKPFGGDPAVVENPDIGFLTLDTPITLPAYAAMTDIVAHVEAGDAISVGAMVRTAELPEAPLAMSATMPLSSTVALGYTHGYGTPYFSHGGDSGAGLFLIENGKRTHKLVGVARQPEPAANLDHFTRIDADFLTWFAANAGP
jgi:hypothetical protein